MYNLCFGVLCMWCILGSKCVSTRGAPHYQEHNAQFPNVLPLSADHNVQKLAQNLVSCPCTTIEDPDNATCPPTMIDVCDCKSAVDAKWMMWPGFLLEWDPPICKAGDFGPSQCYQEIGGPLHQPVFVCDCPYDCNRCP